jgi:hypothetical protein
VVCLLRTRQFLVAMPRKCVVECVPADMNEIYPPNETSTSCNHGKPLASSGAEVPGWRNHAVLPATAKVFYLEPKLGTPSLHADHMVDTAHGPPPQYKQHTMAVSLPCASSRARSVRCMSGPARTSTGERPHESKA